jgi:uncharacterized membrane protein
MTHPGDLDQLLHQATAAATGALRHHEGDGADDGGYAELRPGTELGGGRFLLRGVIGRGGFAITYEAFDRRLERRVAVKELFPGAASRRGRRVVTPPHETEAFTEARHRFLREARVLAQFSHPAIVRIYEVLEENDTAYLVMELLDGHSLATLQVQREGAPFAEPEVLAVAARCGAALTVVHGAGMLHRDLNPSNVVLTSDGRVVIIDFGLAREYGGDGGAPMTRMVTPGYAPPEQYRGEGRFGPPSDVYGLAATLYRLLTGVAPVAAIDRQSGVEVPPPARLTGSVERAVSDAVMDGLELDPNHRPQDMPAFLLRLGLGPQPSTSGPVKIGPPPPVRAPALRPVPTIVGSSAPVKVVVPAPSAPPPALRPVTPPYPYGRPGPAAADPTMRPMALLPPPPVKIPGRWKVVVPAYVAVAAGGAAAPILFNAVLAVVALPVLATAGDVVVLTRSRQRQAQVRKHRLPVPLYAVGRYVRNLLSMAWTAVPALLVAGVLVAATLLLNGSGVSRSVQDWVLRAGGAGVAVLLVNGVFGNRLRFRAAVLEDLVRPSLLDGNGRLRRAGWVVVAGAILLAMVAAAWRPDLWPVRG